MISKIYNSDYYLFEAGSRKGKTRDEITGNELYLNKKVSSKLKMPFGKYKGRFIHNLPIHYIKWFLKNVEKTKYNKHIFYEMQKCTKPQRKSKKGKVYKEIPSVDYEKWKKKNGINPSGKKMRNSNLAKRNKRQ